MNSLTDTAVLSAQDVVWNSHWRLQSALEASIGIDRLQRNEWANSAVYEIVRL